MASIYDQAYIFCNGKPLGEASGGSVKYEGTPIDIETLLGGWKGVSPVPVKCMVSVKSFVNTSGLEFDAVSKFLKTEKITMRVQFGGSGIGFTAEGFVHPPSINFGATSAAEFDFDVRCEAKPLT